MFCKSLSDKLYESTKTYFSLYIGFQENLTHIKMGIIFDSCMYFSQQ